MIQRQILILNPNPIESDCLSKLCQRFGTVLPAESLRAAISRMESSDVQIAVLDLSLASFASCMGSFKKTTGIIITGGDEAKLRSLAREWPADFYVDTCSFSLSVDDNLQFYRVLERALTHTQLKSDLRDARNALDLNEARVKEVYAEIKEIKGLINDNFIKELEKRIAIEAKYAWFQKERQRIEKVLRKPRMVRSGDDLGYLMRALRNTFHSRHRASLRRPQAAGLPEGVELPDHRSGSRPDRAYEAREVFDAIAALPEAFRETLVAVDVAGLSYAETAAALGTREGTVMSRLYRARRGVARSLAA